MWIKTCWLQEIQNDQHSWWKGNNVLEYWPVTVWVWWSSFKSHPAFSDLERGGSNKLHVLKLLDISSLCVLCLYFNYLYFYSSTSYESHASLHFKIMPLSKTNNTSVIIGLHYCTSPVNHCTNQLWVTYQTHFSVTRLTADAGLTKC